MSNEAHYRVTSQTPTVPDYRPIVELENGRISLPARATVIVYVSGEPGLERATIDVELIGRRYEITRLEAVPLPGGGLDLEAVRRLSSRSSFVRNGLAHLSIYESIDGERYSAGRPMEDPDPLWPVALTYSIAYALGESPTKAVAEYFGISSQAAAQRVKRARDAGYLPATGQGSAS